MRWAAIAILALMVLGGMVHGCVTGCGSGYSDGERAATVVKFSRKGILWKSWEGEANLDRMVRGGEGALVVDVFRFSVVDPAVVAKVTAALERGRPARLIYRQWLVHPITQSSIYDVVDVKEPPP